ncbi:MobF family relaxase [Amycolatopsis sp. NBC_01480]|uniref:MobF family relaxase n=1 Tax=Amycolatopsis sp. NBC_01480 TaxID=2903562 RepID=UPI002E2952A8|nr:MobF family relaxase [Amycolatopsis sp. NBC_01480]
MLRMTAISAGMAGAEYLLRAAGCAEHDHAAHSRDASSHGAEYMLKGAELGEPDGVWAGNGLEMLGLADGQQVTAEQMRAVYGRLEHFDKTDAEGNAVPLGRRPRTYASQADRLAAALAAEPNAGEERQEQIRREVRATKRQAVSYYDLTFSPVKSVSVYRAALEANGQHELAAKVTEAHNRAVREALDFIQSGVTTTRVGRHTTVTREDGTRATVGEYAKVKGLVMTLWEHSSSREGDPHIHTHAAILNRTMTEDGRIYAVDGQQFKPLKGAADVVYERRVEELVTEATGARFAWRADGKTREIVGVDRVLCDESSGRRAAIDKRLETLVEDYRTEHGHEPGRQAMAAMRREAWANTRKAKSVESPAALAERYARRQGEDVLKDQVANVAAAAEKIAKDGLPAGQPKFATEDELIVEAVNRTQGMHATWDETALALELNKLIGEVSWGQAAPEEINRLVARAVSPEGPADVLALSGRDRVRVPDALREGGVAEGQPIYRAASSLRYATRDQISAEKALVAEAHTVAGPQLVAERVAAVRADLQAAGLSPDQLNAVVGILTSGKAADTLIGPAGTGKSTTVGQLDRLWREQFGAPVMGLATSQRATDVLEGEGLEALNTAMFLAKYMPEDGSAPKEALARGTMIVVDEAGMADTDKLAKIARLVRQADGKLLYTGDHHQLAAVGTGGLLDLMTRDATPFELAQVWRFRNQWEQDASLKFRVGDAEALTAYEQHGRLRGGSKVEMGEAAVRGYMADVLEGRESVLVVKSNEDAAELSRRVRDELVALGKVSGEEIARLSDDNACGVGDVIQTRLNDHNPVSENGRMVVNRELMTVLGVDERGRLEVERHRDGSKVWLLPDYVEDHATLAYAGTVHSVQGRTTDTSHSLVERGMSRNSAYVEGTRGRDANYFYAVTESDADQHDPETYSVAATDVLREVLGNDGAQVSATETYRAALESADSLQEIGAVWTLAARDAMADHHNDVLLAGLGPDRLDWISKEEGHERLMTSLQNAELRGFDVERVLTAALAADERSLDNATSMSATLRSRIEKIVAAAGDRPVPGRWTRRLQSAAGTVSEYAQELGRKMDERTEMMARAAVLAPPDWALMELGPLPDETDMAARQDWAARVAAVGTYREMYGIDDDQMTIGSAPSREQDPVQHITWHRAWEALGRPEQQADHQTLSVDELRAQVDRWEREQEWAPVYVARELEQAEILAEEYRRESVTRWAQVEAEAAVTEGEITPELQQLVDRAERADRLRERHAAAAERYERLEEARERWAAHTTEVADKAAIATEELDRRGELQVEQPDEAEQMALLGERGRANTDYARVAAAEYDASAVEGELLPMDEDRPVVEPQVEVVDAEVVEPEAVEAEQDTAAGPDVEADEPTLFETEVSTDPAVDADAPVAGTELAVDDALDGELLPAEPESADERQVQAEADIEDADVVEDVTWDELDQQREDAEKASKPAEADREDERGDYGTRYRLDEMAEVDEERFPAPVEVDPAQEQLFPIEAEASDRVALGKVRDDVDLTIKNAETVAKLSDETIAGRDLRSGWDTDRDEAAEQERRRADRERVDREAQQENQQQRLRDLAAQQAREQSRNAEREMHL